MLFRQGDVEGTYKFASSNIKAVFTTERFASMLQSEFYSPLLGHFQHKIMLSIMLENNVLKQLVSVQVEPGESAVSSSCIFPTLFEYISLNPFKNHTLT